MVDKLAAALTDYVDDIAERAVSMGGTAMGTNRMSAAEASGISISGDGQHGTRQELVERCDGCCQHARRN